MKNWVIKSNNWYDNLKEPKRFLFLMFSIALPISFSLALLNHGIYWVSPVLIITMLLWRMGGSWYATTKPKPLTQAEKLVLRSVDEINHFKYVYKDKGHAEKYLKDVEDYFNK